MSKLISSVKLSDTLTISLCTDGYWLYDKTRGMNLSMRAKTTDNAFTEALMYYQERLIDIEKEYNNLKSKVDEFVNKIIDEENN